MHRLLSDFWRADGARRQRNRQTIILRKSPKKN